MKLIVKIGLQIKLYLVYNHMKLALSSGAMCALAVFELTWSRGVSDPLM